ncbi:SUMF1/EgtB/PvdO family nonheme iron enzyme [Tumidithrix elongata RA019]|uniref:SUMF1/EgtB/PvdO family nonheme iron enzyme n=1 Tax=Tumidithrix elongata BACA0141 TaxID=2716417 RepID=A0AAW9Q9R2_9CYAN|nr:SUMF1/EgtB/PvdO family nonheme iron enzyme [Tumidithrix elongata RA019]
MLTSQSYSPSGQLTKSQVKQWYQQCRQATLSLFEGIDRTTFCRQAHSDFSPIGWHLGHIGFTESVWLLHRTAGLPAIEPPHYLRLFAADGLPKVERDNLPTFEQICDYLNCVRDRVFRYLEDVSPEQFQQQQRLWYWLLQHESQHAETITIVLHLHNLSAQLSAPNLLTEKPRFPKLRFRNSSFCNQDIPNLNDAIEIPAGSFQQGYGGLAALDNESPPHSVYLDTYSIDRYPITRAQYGEFIQSGGYQQSQWWSEAGWQWLQTSLVQGEKIAHPLYWNAWQDSGDSDPVCGISWYEADAYARSVGKRLPTEAEWEKATVYLNLNAERDYPMLGNVWEWTSTLFYPYPHFMPFPYAGYSSAYFDDRHFVLRGGSWATQPWALRPTFRNWYHPHVRQIFAGLRCVQNLS